MVRRRKQDGEYRIVLIPIFAAVIVFFLVHGIFGALVPGSSIALSLVAACFIYFVSSKKVTQLNLQRDSAQTLSYHLPAPQAFSLVKKVVRTFRWGERKWQITDADETALTIRAVSEWKDYAFKDYKLLAPDGGLFRQVVLNVRVRQEFESGFANIEMAWMVNSPLVRSECDKLQNHTKSAIQQVLEDNQIDQSVKIEIL
jgi:hypothetical protein